MWRNVAKATLVCGGLVAAICRDDNVLFVGLALFYIVTVKVATAYGLAMTVFFVVWDKLLHDNEV